MKDFLKILNSRLYFLNKEEKNKILEEYRDKIENDYKVTHNMKETINKLGDMDSIVNDICDRYNLSRSLSVRNNKFDKDVTACSKMLGNFIRDIMKIVRKTRLQHNLQSFLEASVKLIYLVIVFTLIKLPFILFEKILYSINNFLFYPYEDTFNVCSDFILSIVYFIICIIITLRTFGDYRIKNKKIVDEEKVNNIDKEYNWLDLIIRLFIYVIILVPIGILIILSIALACLLLYLFTTGINIIGLPIMLFGLSGLLIGLFMIILDALKQKDRSYSILVLLSMFVFIIGFVISISNYNSFKKTSDISKSVVEMKTEEVNITLKDEIKHIIVEQGNYELLEDESLSDNDIRVKVTYCDDYYDVKYDQVISDGYNYIYFKPVLDNDFNNGELINNVLTDLRKNYLIDYTDVKEINIKIYANKHTINKIK